LGLLIAIENMLNDEEADRNQNRQHAGEDGIKDGVVRSAASAASVLSARAIGINPGRTRTRAGRLTHRKLLLRLQRLVRSAKRAHWEGSGFSHILQTKRVQPGKQG
jgi:hypothetical protein